MSPFLFLLVIDWTMKETTDNQQTGIQWNQQQQLLDNLDFADDITLVSSNNHQMQDKTTRMTGKFCQTGAKGKCCINQDHED